MRGFIFFSVHERMFDAIARDLVARGVVDGFGGFLWGVDQLPMIDAGQYEPLLVFSRDIRPTLDRPPDLDVLRAKERRYGVSFNRLIYSERHLLEGRNFEQRLRLVEALFRAVEDAYDRCEPDFILTEDVSCLSSYVHWVVATHRGIPFHSIAQGVLPGTIAIHSSPMQRLGSVEERFDALKNRSLAADEREEATIWLREFRKRPRRPTGASAFDRLPVADLGDLKRVVHQATRYVQERHNPTLRSPTWALKRRATRLVNQRATQHLFEKPVPGERYLIFPIHYQPEASTLIRGLYYLDQPALVDDIAKSLPVGTRLYVKEHYANRGRRPASFYQQIKSSHAVRLLGPDENAWDLVQGAAGVVTITSRMGWEGILAEKPVFTFGETFYNCFPLVTRLGTHPKDHWPRVIADTLETFEPNSELLLKYIAALQASLFPGFKGNAQTFPQVMEPANIQKLADATQAVLEGVS
ncbi:MAG: hypothetical protein AAF436_18680 [Myxococcota bacterium]